MKALIVFASVVSAAYAASGPAGVQAADWSNIRAEYERHLQAAFPADGGHQARNYAQQWVTRFDDRGFEVTPDAAGWRWGLELRSYGFPGRESNVKHARTVADVEKLSYHWDSLITEWFVNQSGGLEHGFTLASRPVGDASTLNLHLAVRGTLAPRISNDGRSVSFLGNQGAPTLNYAGLKVTDADGIELAARFVEEPQGLRLEVEQAHARYPVTIDPVAQQAYLKPGGVATAQVNHWFGYSVSISGDTVVVGAPQEDSSTLGVNSTPNDLAEKAGAAYVFVRSAGVWSQQAYLKPAAVGTGQTDDRFGWSVAISGDTIVVGAVREDSNTTGTTGTPTEGSTDSGAAYVFTRSGGTWSQQAYLKPAAFGTSQSSDEFGYSVAISGDTIAVGAYGESSSSTGVNSSPNELASGAGAAYVFFRSGTAWTQQAYLKPSAVGTTQANDHFGASIAVNGDTVVVGAFLEDSSSTGINSTPNDAVGGSGAAYVFFRNGSTWTQQAYLKPAVVGTSQAGDAFGFSVAVSGDTVVVGANAESSSSTGINSAPNETAGSAGAVYVFTRSAGLWSQQAYVKPAAVGSTQNGDGFGASVAISGDVMVVGAPTEDSSSTGINSTPNELAPSAGAAYVFIRHAGVWTQEAYVKPAAVGSTQAGDQFGISIAVSESTMVVGAYLEDGATLGVNGTPSEGATDAGAAYVFTVPGPAGIITPVPGSVLSGTSITFTWSPSSDASAYWLDVGTAQGQGNIFGQNVGLATSQTVTGIPANGSTIYVRLWTLVNGAWRFTAYTYTASSGTGSSAATIVSPTPGSTLSSSVVTFTWTASGATAYWLDVGTASGQGNIFGQNLGTATTQTVTGLPTGGGTIFVKLWSQINGIWQGNSYTYTAGAGSTLGVITAPAPGSTFSGSTITFTWTSAGAAAYWLDVGTAAGQGNIFGQNVGTATSQVVTGIPTSATTVYVKLWSLIGTVWQANAYTYTAAAGTAKGVITAPTPGSTLTGSTVTFTWSPGTGAAGYWLDVGTAAGQGNLFGQSSALATTQVVSGLPTTPVPIYVRLWTLLGSVWQFNDYTYTAAAGAASAVITAPTPSSTLAGSNVTFTWTAVGASAYWLDVGTAAGQGNIFGQNLGTATSQVVTGVPTGGSTVYVKLWSLFNGAWRSNAYTYTTSTGTGAAVISAPARGSTLSGSSVTFTWTATGAVAYWLDVGTAAGQGNIFGQNLGTATSQLVTGIPTTGGTVYVKLWSLINSVWQSNSYTYTAFK